ncbi:hypothetical protein BX600DRAFT_440159 [Xylariales sp. PMI_506]|nr:hypothetical protein BX600DRAFT_440159 [Xylariales sp. PMI_506]
MRLNIVIVTDLSTKERAEAQLTSSIGALPEKALSSTQLLVRTSLVAARTARRGAAGAQHQEINEGGERPGLSDEAVAAAPDEEVAAAADPPGSQISSRRSTVPPPAPRKVELALLVGGGARCWKCTSGHTCSPTSVLPLARRLVAALKEGENAEARRLRAAVRVLLDTQEEEDDDDEEDGEEKAASAGAARGIGAPGGGAAVVDAGTPEARRGEIRARTHSLLDTALDFYFDFKN